MTREILTIPGTAQHLGCTTKTVHNLHNSGKIRIRKLGGRSVIYRDELERYLNNLPARPMVKAG